MPMNRVPSSTAMTVSVVAALRGSGRLKAGTPLATASTPVRATEPLAKARRSSRTVTACSGEGAPGTGSTASAPAPRKTIW